MASTSYFKSEDKLKDKSDCHAWKMTLELSLEEHDAMVLKLVTRAKLYVGHLIYC